MFRHKSLIALAIASWMTFVGTAFAAETLKWEDLAPSLDDLQSPLTQLSDKQQDDLYAILWGPNFGGPSGKMNADERKAYHNLRASGIDPEAMIAKIKGLREEADRRDKILIFELDARVIKLSGYVVPLDFDGTLVKSFLLVPYVGACIHVPPPPPNQIVHVEVKEGFSNQQMFAPVWVTGRVRVGMGKRSLTLVDGSNDVDIGYSLKATKIEPYEN